MSTANRCINIRYISQDNQQGLTLIEVLIALAIIAIALTAVIKATSQNIRATTYLQNKSQAMWVAQNIMNEVRVGILQLPAGETRQESMVMLNQEWFWQAEKETTPNKKIDKITVNVFRNESQIEEATPVVTLESYVQKTE